MGRAADLLGMQPASLHSLDAAGPLTPDRSVGGQRRYSRAELALALRVRELLDQNMPLAAAIRIVSSNTNSPQPTSASLTSNNHRPAPQRPSESGQINALTGLLRARHPITTP
ncbi:MAG: helix-turn-helix domain-containing protein [Actinomycetota bacterium]|nr:helix-turn-helix domain-containing protein [Actinomycetota bacterium]